MFSQSLIRSQKDSAHQFGSPVTVYGNVTESKNHPSDKSPLRIHAAGGQTKPVLGGEAILD